MTNARLSVVIPNYNFAKYFPEALFAKHSEAVLWSSVLKLIGQNGEDKCWISTPVVAETACSLSPKKVIADLMVYGLWFMVYGLWFMV